MAVETKSGAGAWSALWYVAPGVAELRGAPVAAPGSGEARLAMQWSGVSRGTERLVFNGKVPASEHERMRAPMQEGDFPFPVKYGYCAVARVEEGPADLLGKTVFCLHPHQSRFIAPVSRLTVLPDGLPPRRATLAANMETALNALWDSGAGPADRITVVGAGIVGLLVAYLAARMPGAEVTVIDPVAERKPLVEALGCKFSSPLAGEVGRSSGGGAGTNADVVFHTSASEAGLATALGSAGMEGTVVELSWYGDKRINVPLGDAFHSQRLKLICSQVGQVSAGRRIRWDYRRRIEAALHLLADDRLDALLSTEIAFDDAPAKLPGLLAPDAPGLAPVIRY